MSKKLAAKASQIHLPPLLHSPAAPAVERSDHPEVRPKTAPGSMAAFMASQSVAVKEAEELRQQLRAFDGAKPVRMLDPQTVQPSRWANRHEASFGDAAFAELKADIASAGTNVQPISVREMPAVLNGSTPAQPQRFEVVFGHRRHRACLELGLPLQAMVTTATDVELFEAMDRENRARKNLSAWEQGQMYRRALDEGLYPSQRRLSEALGVDVSLVSKSIALARLPEAVVAAFASPIDIQFRWAQPLSEVLQKDPEGVLARAEEIRRSGAIQSAVDVFNRLVSPADERVLNGSTPSRKVITGAAGKKATVARDARGGVRVDFAPGALSAEAESELVAFIERKLSKK